MKLAILAAIAALFVYALPVGAAKPEPSGTIAIAPGSDLSLGGTVTFDVTTSDLPGTANPRIQVVCAQAGEVVYGEAHSVEADFPFPLDGPAFILGGGSSDWLTNGGAAECEATLYYWDFHPVQTFVPLAAVSFSAGG